MRFFMVGFLLSLFSSVDAHGRDTEPSRQYQLDINGEKLLVEIGIPQNTQVNGQPLTVRLNVRPLRHFEKHGVEFDFPERFVYSYDNSDPNVEIWSVEGTEAIIMLQRFNIDLSAVALAPTMLTEVKRQYGAMLSKEEAVKLKTDNRTLDGTRLHATVGDVSLIQEYYAFDIPSGHFLLMLQDTRDQGQATAEFQQINRLLSETFSTAK